MALASASNLSEIETILGPPIGEYRKLSDVHPSLSEGIFSFEDESSGLVLRRYNLWFIGLGFHVGYKTIMVKFDPRNNVILATKIRSE